MPELRLPTLTDAGNPRAVLGWASDLIFQLRRQFVPLLRRVEPLSPYGLQAVDGPGTVFTLPWFKTDVAIIDVSLTATAVGLVRPGLTFAVFAQNLTAIVGPASYKVGTTTPADNDAWHAAHEVVVENLEDTAAWIDTTAFTITPPVKYDAQTDILLTPVGGAFVSGSVKLIAFTLDFKPL